MNEAEGEQPQKRVKTVPVKIVESKKRESAIEAPTKFKQCKLHFDMKPNSETDVQVCYFYNQTPTLVFTALQNKQMVQHLQNEHISKMHIAMQQPQPAYAGTPKLQGRSKLTEEILREITQQHKQYQGPAIQKQPDQVLKNIMDDALVYIESHNEAVRFVSSWLQGVEQLIVCFKRWLSKQLFNYKEDVLLACSSNLRDQSTQEEQIIEHFKALFKRLLLVYLRKHAFCDAIRSNDPPSRLELQHELLHKMLKPDEFYVFK